MDTFAPLLTALALNVLNDSEAMFKARMYMQSHIVRHGATSYWWRTPFYILYELNVPWNPPYVEGDAIELSLAMLLKTKQKLVGTPLIQRLLALQNVDGSFPPSRQFRIPRPHQTLDQLTGFEEIIEDKYGIFSTCAALVALTRQGNLLTQAMNDASKF